MKKYYIAIVILVAVSVATIATYYLTFANNVRDVVKEQDISALSQAVDNYVGTNKQLPDSLKQIKVDNGVKQRLDRYSYKKVGEFTYKGEFQLRYELCTTFKSETKQTATRYESGLEYETYPNTYNHKAGPVCYKLFSYLPLTGGLFEPTTKAIEPSKSTGTVAGRDSQRMSDLRSLKTASELYFNDNGFYPAAATWKNDLIGGDLPYIKSIPLDPATGATYSYVPSPEGCKGNCTSYALTAQLENKKDSQADSSGRYIVNSAN